MTMKDFEFFKRNLNGCNGCIVECGYVDDVHINTIYVLASEGEYKIIKDNASDTYLVEYIPNFGSKELSVHLTMSGAIEYIKGGDKYVE